MRKEVIVKNNYSRTTNGYPVHRIEFDGVSYDVIGNGITLREAEIFKEAILAERERIWNEAYGNIDTDIIKLVFDNERARTGQHISLKKDIIKNVLQDKKVIIVDVNNEYKGLVESINSDSVRLINIKR